jgi:DNA (cytosine-5)-methyltransferase 1
MSEKLRFVDLFAGLGGFNVGLSKLGFTCVFAVEIDSDLNNLYHRNFGIKPAYDIRGVDAKNIPNHEILCAGFPCQPFSKAGFQFGLEDSLNGDLFENHLLRIIKHHTPKYLILENVPNLLKHNDGNTWALIKKSLEKLNYHVNSGLLSPHEIGIPQIRKRLFVVASQKDLKMPVFPVPEKINPNHILTILEKDPLKIRKLPIRIEEAINVWQEFVELYPKEFSLPSFPIWAQEFGATYEFETSTPLSFRRKKLLTQKGSLGIKFKNMNREEIIKNLPPYARSQKESFPSWKIKFIKQNRELYARNKKWIDKWVPKLGAFPPSLQKLEWNCKGEKRDIWAHIIQIRASGIRVKRSALAPSIVAMTTTQIPIIGWEKRYMTIKEVANLQSISELKELPESESSAYKAMGNAVNAELVKIVGKSILKSSEI